MWIEAKDDDGAWLWSVNRWVNIVRLTAYRYIVLSSWCIFPIKSEYDISFLKKSLIKIVAYLLLKQLKFYLFLCVQCYST